ncbi:IS4/IS5 family transposase [Burkholderia sp. Bp8986]|nr:transposase [Burkholderia sp. Bp8986]RQS41463.1 IS4/IS5 family transposase [Burkholderia sp. Bp8986]
MDIDRTFTATTQAASREEPRPPAGFESSHAVGAGQKLGETVPIECAPVPSTHIVTDANGTPLAAILTGANVSDVTQLLPLIDAIPPIRRLRGHPLSRPRVVYADRGYDSERHRRCVTRTWYRASVR